MQSRLLLRETGDVSPREFQRALISPLLTSFAPAPHHRFDGDLRTPNTVPRELRAHGAGVGCLAVDKFDGRLLLSGGSDGSIKLWDLESAGSPTEAFTFRPVSTITRSTDEKRGAGHSHGITHLDFFPFDPEAFLSSSYDKSLRLWSTQRCVLTAQFDLNATIYSHSTSPIADHLLVACATQSPNVRLVDLRSGAAVQALVAHSGPVLCTSWCPRQENILLSGHADGSVKVWDTRRAGGCLTQLDMEDSLGVVRRFRNANQAGTEWASMQQSGMSAHAHDGPVNGITWSDNGNYIVTAGLDRRIRVWDASTGRNTLANFGSLIQNSQPRTASMVVTPSGLASRRELIAWPNEQEILLLDLHEGSIVTRLRGPNPAGARARATEMARSRITSMVWRSAGGSTRQIGPVMGGGNSVGAMYSAHQDGHVRAWFPQIPGPDDVDEKGEVEEGDDSKKRKRKVVDDAYRSLMGRQITFT